MVQRQPQSWPCAKRYRPCLCSHSADHLSLLSADTIFICGLFTHHRGHKGSNCSQAGVSTAAALRDQRVGVRHISLDFTDCCCMAVLSEQPRIAWFNKREEHVGEEQRGMEPCPCSAFTSLPCATICWCVNLTQVHNCPPAKLNIIKIWWGRHQMAFNILVLSTKLLLLASWHASPLIIFPMTLPCLVSSNSPLMHTWTIFFFYTLQTASWPSLACSLFRLPPPTPHTSFAFFSTLHPSRLSQCPVRSVPTPPAPTGQVHAIASTNDLQPTQIKRDHGPWIKISHAFGRYTRPKCKLAS